jgi:DNA polymerase-3 subunit gamma/tau
VSYLVLARKYRPATFADVIGQEHVVRTLQNAITLGRVHHAFVFTGARGVGKTTCARVLAKALNCDLGMRPDPCGVCASCKDIAAGVHPDVLEIDGASNTGVDNVRELRETVRYLPSRSRFKLYIIDEVHMLSQAAFNALLKTLEEPPAHVKFIFATTEPQKIPITILSRCQRFDFRRVSTQTLAEHLRSILGSEKVEIGASALSAIVREAQGSVRDALSLLDQVLSYAGNAPTDEAVVAALGLVDRQTIFELFDAVLARDANRLLSIIADVDIKGHELGDVASLFVDHLRDVMVAKSIAEPTEAQLDRSPGELEALRAQAKKVSAPDLHRMFALAVEVAEDVARSSFARVSFEMGLLRLLEVEPTERIEALLARLESSGGASGGAGAKRAEAPKAENRRPTIENRPTDNRTTENRTTENRPTDNRTTDNRATDNRTTENRPTDNRTTDNRPTDNRPTDNRAPEPRQSSPTSKPSAKANDGPAPIQPPSSGEVTWAWFVNQVRAARPALSAVLEHGRPLSFNADGVELGYAPKTFYWDKAHDPDCKTTIEASLAQAFGKPVPLKLTAIAPEEAPTESLAEAADRRKKTRHEEIRKTAVEHPAVVGALTHLGGEIKEVIVREPDVEG